MKITELKCNYQDCPIGISLDKVTFTWKCTDAKGKRTARTKFVIAADESFDHIVHVEEKDGTLSPYVPETELLPGKTYFWKVEVTDDANDTCKCEVKTFVGGHPDGRFWGKWITPAFSKELHPVFRKKFELGSEQISKLKKGRLYICGLGLYEAYLNGQKIGDDYLAPYFTDYRYWVQYQTYDIKDLLKEGENTIDVYLGNG
ncbi:MAG: alpha-L-rhamnosidase N-terminal domain-containing protein, partial [Butyrivibrio sp.]|nr:alpha-L-rhamnosidase N-terminal domain-containing protein [Butyrivibrio sp.]